MIKSGIMVGLGQTSAELARLFDDLAAAGVGILMIGQYLQPARGHLAPRRNLTAGGEARQMTGKRFDKGYHWKYNFC